MKKTAISFGKKTVISFIATSCILLMNALFSQEKAKDDDALLEQYIRAQKDIIVFDASNIKQFWIDKTVLKFDDCFEIMLDKKETVFFESIPLKIQLINVSETQDCNIEIISEDADISFSVLNNNRETIASSFPEDNKSFIQYNVCSASFHLEHTQGQSFYIKFSSNKLQTLSIKKIVLSFSKNQNSSFLSSPGSLKVTQKNVTGKGFTTKQITDDSFAATGVKYTIISNNKILVSDKPVSNSITIKNTGANQTKIYIGYAPYTKEGNNIHNRNNPYKNANSISKVVSAKEKSNSITIDSFLDWEKGCYLALHAKEDLSDFPNFNIIDSKIIDIKKIDESHSEVILEKPINYSIPEGTPVRVQSPHAHSYLYTNTKVLQPGEEVSFSSTLKKDESFYQFSSKAFCRGTYYVVPVIYSGSVEPDAENTILISNFIITY